MTCTTCGRENAAHLTFCQECGQRLGPRIAPPTPPIGLGGSDAYGPPPVVPPGAPAPPVAAAPRPVPGGERRCKVCDTVNAPNLRYCTSCGSTLEAAPAPSPSAMAPAPAPAAAPPPAHPPAPPPPVAPAMPVTTSPVLAQHAPVAAPAPAPAPPPAAVAPQRVVDLASTQAAPEGAVRICARCRGVADAGAQFCKFCGAPLETSSPNVGAAAAALPPRAEPVADPFGRAPARGPTAPLAAVAQQVLPSRPPQPSTSERPSPYGAPPRIEQSGASALAAIPRPASVPPPPAPAAPPPAPAAPPAPALQSAPPPVAPSAPASSPAITRGRLVVIAKSGADGPSYPFGDLLDVGRTEGNVVVGEDPYLSPRHVRILFHNGKLILRDLASTNGVYLRLAPSRDTSGRKPGESPEIVIPLVDQDVVLVGQQVLRFDILKEGDGGLGPAQEHGTLLFGSPAAPRYARLCQRTVEGIARDVYYVRKVETVLGRESGDIVFTEDPFLSRRHAAVRLVNPPAAGGKAVDPRFQLVDLGSSNGTFLRLRGDVELAPGDHFRVGQQLFRVDFNGPRPGDA